LNGRVITSAVVIMLLIGGAAGYLIGVTRQQATTTSSTTTVSTTIFSTTTTTLTTLLIGQNGRPYLKEPAIYSALGYPKVLYNGNSPYVAPEPNYTFSYSFPHALMSFGSVAAPTIGLTSAVGLAAEAAGLDPSNFSLAEAIYTPGDIENGSVSSHPSWGLYFAESHDGYWVFGSCGDGAYSAFASVDALNGIVSRSSPFYCPGGSLPASGNYELRVNSTEAMDQVRAANLSGIPTALEKNGTVSSLEPRIVMFGSTSNNIAFQNPLNASFSDTTRLCWVVQLSSPVPDFGYQGTFAIDAESGKLVSGWSQEMYPGMQYQYAKGSPIFSSANNLRVLTESFRIDGNAFGVRGSVPVAVQNVVVAMPGTAGVMALNFSSNYDVEEDANFSFVNLLSTLQTLLPNGLPPGVSIQTSPKSLVIPGNGQTQVNLSISVDQSAPEGTYLVDLHAEPSDPLQNEVNIYFFLSIWNGIGQWPPPPGTA
jgi:hypothetical protein